MKNRKHVLSILALGISLSLSPFYAAFANAADAAQPQTLTPTPNNAASQSLPSLAPMLEKILPAVVTVKTKGKNVAQTTQNNIPEEFRFFFPFFAEQQTQPRVVQGLGSGVIIDAKKGYIVTNNHVVKDADEIAISLNDGREFPAKLIGKDTQSDIAVLQIEKPTDLAEMHLADSDKLRVGDFAVAIGNPFGLGQTVTSGIVSALARSGLNVSGIENFIQTDASINRGNSGGALVNLNGELIGINTAIIAPGGGNVGIGFAIPSNMVRDLTSQIIQFGNVQRGLLGIKGLELNSELAKVFKLNVQKGAFVAEVIADSSAEKGGIQAGDVIVSIDDRPIASFSDLRARIATMGIGKKIKLGIIRDDKALTLDVTLQSNQGSKQPAKTILPQLAGAEFSDANADGVEGVHIDSVTKDSFAARLGLKENDVIVAVNSEKIKKISDLKRIVDSKPAAIALKIMRGKSTVFLVLRTQ